MTRIERSNADSIADRIFDRVCADPPNPRHPRSIFGFAIQEKQRMSTPVEVVHNEALSRFEVNQDGHLAELDYRRVGDQIIFTHTGVPAALEGRGIGSALAKTGLKYAQDNQLEVVPLCPFVKGYIERKPEYQSLVKQESSGGFA
jgi:predicted GNAT family acetyltransferase